MIQTEKGYRQTKEMLTRMQIALEDSRSRLLPNNPTLYNLESAGTLSEIEELEKEIREYEIDLRKKAG
jgi:hypothetical protein